MNKLIAILFLTTIVLVVTSCGKDFLNVTPKNSLNNNNFWQSKEDATLALNGAYRNWETWANIIIFDAMSDNAYYDGWSNKIDGSATPTNVSNSYWMDQYAGHWFDYQRIQKYNRFLANIENVSMDNSLKQRYKAEVRFLRAYNYLYKVMLYGDMPLVTEPIAADIEMARTPQKEVKKFILNELDEISKSLPIQNQIQSGGHVTKGAALALKARLELYMGKYINAMADAKAVIDMGVYSLHPDYRELFLNDNNKEAILSIQYIKDAQPTRYAQFLSPGMEGGYANMSPTKSMINAYQTINGLSISEDPIYDPENPFENRDPRLKMSILYPGQRWNGRYYNPLDQQVPNENGELITNKDYHGTSVGPPGGSIPKKYIEPMTVVEMKNNGNNIIVIRLAEMYLTFAEAALESGKNTELGLQYLNKVRTRAGMPAATKLTEELVRYERRIEFAFENLRYFDIKRWDLGPRVLNGPVYGTRKGSVNMKTGKVTWGSERLKLNNRTFVPERNYLLPIPQHEMDVNSKMTQNPGY